MCLAHFVITKAATAMLTENEVRLNIFSNYKDFGGDFGVEINKSLDSFDSLDIASGFFGSSLVENLTPKLIEIAKRGYCRILLGMIFNGGVTSNQKVNLEKLDAELRKVNDRSGVFVTRENYHGKIYKFSKKNEEKIYVGSSNFSRTSFHDNYEFNAIVSDTQTKEQVSKFLEFIFSQECKFTSKLQDVELTVKGLKSKKRIRKNQKFSLSEYKIPVKKFPNEPVVSEVKITLRVDEQPASSLNLFFEDGRSANGKYTRRPWYESEITSTAKERTQEHFPFGEFLTYIKDGDDFYELSMKTYSDNFKALSTTGNRELLGELIKGRLEKEGLLNRGERITSSMLKEYGKDYVILKKFADKKFYFEF